jgi:hypothetical protein
MKKLFALSLLVFLFDQGRYFRIQIVPDGSIDGGAAYGKMTKK